MERGKVVVTDRYIDSSVAYQGAGRELDADEVARLSRWATAGLVPDLTVVLDLPPEIYRVRRSADPQRHGEDRMEAQSEEFHERVRQRFLDLAHREPHRYLVLDGSDPREQVQEAIRRRVRDLIPISRRHRADLEVKLVEEEATRRRRAAAESEVRRLDAELRGRSRDEARAREEARQRARAEAEEQLRRETQGRRGAGSGPRSGEDPPTGEETWFGTEPHGEGTHGEGPPSGEGTRPGGRSGDGPRPGDPGADRRTGQPPGAVDLGAADDSAADVGAADPGAPETEGRHPGRPGPGRRPWGASSPWGRNPKGPGSSG
jgi:dTMP kinase